MHLVSGCGARCWEFSSAVRLLGKEPASIIIGKPHSLQNAPRGRAWSTTSEYSRSPVSAQSVSAISLICSLPQLYIQHTRVPPCGLCPTSLYVICQVPSYPRFQASTLERGTNFRTDMGSYCALYLKP